jgi:hypothetical protein
MWGTCKEPLCLAQNDDDNVGASVLARASAWTNHEPVARAYTSVKFCSNTY